MSDNDEEEQGAQDAIEKTLKTIGDRISERTSALVEEKKLECQTIIESLKQESAIATLNLEGAIQKLRILHEGNIEKTEALSKNYHEALANITVINAKLESLNNEVASKLRIVEKGFLQLFEEEDKNKSAIEKTQCDLARGSKQSRLIIKKLFGTPFDDDEENKQSLVYRVVSLEKESKIKLEKLAAQEEIIGKLNDEIKLLKERVAKLERFSLTRFTRILLHPFKKAISEMAVVIAKSMLIKLLTLFTIGLGIYAKFEKHILVILEDLF